ncbi:hypothetical protein EPD60_00935 [Flaviaesturariibacter flavus]|uniref:Bacterial spore germination immunoglobulin-like domain-containing protein n=1 Tax=Flaviaesturariibacter flavus TaxID=2502780 RepID=A0A4R1BNG6_9BACT|nr:Gmad2 immunoglobulin-like domain-containing protein [Flaviaesturariibacter flavus]TCJ19011.1 hypothetical protein EPD60_00935 [Flaviaesturariibacter flavus]
MKHHVLVLLFLFAACGHDANKEKPDVSAAPVGVDAPFENKGRSDSVKTVAGAAHTGIPDTLTVEQRNGTVLHSGQIIRGKARGLFYFEAQFLLRLFDSSGRQLAMAPATAEGDWMTTSWVPFSGRLQWKNYNGPGRLVYEKANASGDPERDRSYSVPVLLVEKEK